ncbi:MAG TPA: glycosyl hydrolase 108 family protein [Caulobacteraceae bacterium]|nr:glycosyl hydrolase 108 family protein [Caulobacteraceae bacterium]
MGAIAKIIADDTAAQHARFLVVWAPIAPEEGGLSDTPGDRGGLTNCGVTLRFLQAQGQIDPVVAQAFDLDGNHDLDDADIRDLTPELAAELYERCLWVRGAICTLPAPIDGMILDQAINCGLVGAYRILQRAINAVGPQTVTVDGDLGDITRDALAQALLVHHSDVVVEAVRKAAMDHYRSICVADPAQLRFLNAWLNRAEALGHV